MAGPITLKAIPETRKHEERFYESHSSVINAFRRFAFIFRGFEVNGNALINVFFPDLPVLSAAAI